MLPDLRGLRVYQRGPWVSSPQLREVPALMASAVWLKSRIPSSFTFASSAKTRYSPPPWRVLILALTLCPIQALGTSARSIPLILTHELGLLGYNYLGGTRSGGCATFR